MDFANYEAKHFNELDNATWRIIRDYYYAHGFWINHNFDHGRSRTHVMLTSVAVDWNNECTLEQIKCVKQYYQTLSRVTCERKQELTSTPDFDSASNPKFNTADQKSQKYQEIRYQTLPKKPNMQPLYPAPVKPSSYIYQPYQIQQTRNQPILP